MANGMSFINGELEFNGKIVPSHCYDPKNFTYDAHGQWIEAAKEKGFTFIKMDETTRHAKSIVLKHDVNYSIESALPVASTNTEHGVVSTFFINPDSQFYSISNPEHIAVIKEIQDMGHAIGVLVSPRDESGAILPDEDISKKVVKCVDALKSAGVNPSAFSFDLVGPEAKRLSDGEVIKVGGVQNVYGHTFADGVERVYLSNSNGMFLYGTTPADAISDPNTNALFVLVHTDWLTKEPKLPYDRLAEQVAPEKWDTLKATYLDLVPQSNRCVMGDGLIADLDEHAKSLINARPEQRKYIMRFFPSV